MPSYHRGYNKIPINQEDLSRNGKDYRCPFCDEIVLQGDIISIAKERG